MKKKGVKSGKSKSGSLDTEIPFPDENPIEEFNKEMLEQATFLYFCFSEGSDLRELRENNPDGFLIEPTFNDDNHLASVTYTYFNNLGQKFLIVHQEDVGHPGVLRNFYIYDNQGREIAHIGELENGHLYCNEYEYNSKGNKYLAVAASLNPDVDLYEMYKESLSNLEKNGSIW